MEKSGTSIFLKNFVLSALAIIAAIVLVLTGYAIGKVDTEKKVDSKTTEQSDYKDNQNDSKYLKEVSKKIKLNDKKITISLKFYLEETDSNLILDETGNTGIGYNVEYDIYSNDEKLKSDHFMYIDKKEDFEKIDSKEFDNLLDEYLEKSTVFNENGKDYYILYKLEFVEGGYGILFYILNDEGKAIYETSDSSNCGGVYIYGEYAEDEIESDSLKNIYGNTGYYSIKDGTLTILYHDYTTVKTKVLTIENNKVYEDLTAPSPEPATNVEVVGPIC